MSLPLSTCPSWAQVAIYSCTHNVPADVSVGVKEADVVLNFKSVFGHIYPLHVVETVDECVSRVLDGEKETGRLVQPEDDDGSEKGRDGQLCDAVRRRATQ